MNVSKFHNYIVKNYPSGHRHYPETAILHGQAMVKLAEEIAKSGIPEGSRKINGRYIQSHLLSRLEGSDRNLDPVLKIS